MPHDTYRYAHWGAVLIAGPGPLQKIGEDVVSWDRCRVLDWQLAMLARRFRSSTWGLEAFMIGGDGVKARFKVVTVGRRRGLSFSIPQYCIVSVDRSGSLGLMRSVVEIKMRLFRISDLGDITTARLRQPILVCKHALDSCAMKFLVGYCSSGRESILNAVH